MTQVIPLLNYIVGVLTSILGLLGVIQTQSKNDAKELAPFAIQTDVDTTLGLVTNSVFGLSALKAVMDSGFAAAHADALAILTAIANLTNGVTPVSLPVTPPAGYGGASTGTIADAVWNYPMPFGAGIAIDGLTDAHWLALNLSSVSAALPSAVNPDWWVGGAWDRNCTPERPDTSLPTLDYTTILLTDATTVDWLNRVYPSYGPFSFTGEFASINDPTCSFYFFLPVSQPQFDAIKAGLFPTVSRTAPVWPGIGNVTLGTTLALSDGLTVPGPLDGVIVHIASVSYPISFYPFGTLKSFVKVGGIVFVDDNGQGEMAQPLGLAEDVVCPRTMVEADHALLRLQSGVVGTITPWTTP